MIPFFTNNQDNSIGNENLNSIIDDFYIIDNDNDDNDIDDGIDNDFVKLDRNDTNVFLIKISNNIQFIITSKSDFNSLIGNTLIKKGAYFYESKCTLCKICIHQTPDKTFLSFEPSYALYQLLFTHFGEDYEVEIHAENVICSGFTALILKLTTSYNKCEIIKL